jgi:hypothetical protein
METITEKLDKLPPSIFERNEGCTEEMIVEVEGEFGLKFPEDYRQLLLLSNSGSIKGSHSVFNYEPVEYLVGHNLSEFFNANIPGVIVIGDDGGGSIYFYDPRNKLNKGPWSLFYVSMGALFFKESVHVAGSLTELIDKILAGENFGDLLFK